MRERIKKTKTKNKNKKKDKKIKIKKIKKTLKSQKEHILFPSAKDGVEGEGQTKKQKRFLLEMFVFDYLNTSH